MYKYKHTFSQINQKYLFIEKNENWVPTYYILYKDSFFDQMRKLIDYLESIGEEPPKGSYLLLQNVINGENSEFEDFFTKQISINWNIYSRIYNTNEKFLNQYEENKNNKRTNTIDAIPKKKTPLKEFERYVNIFFILKCQHIILDMFSILKNIFSS